MRTTNVFILGVVLTFTSTLIGEFDHTLLVNSVDEFLIRQMELFDCCRPSEQPPLVQTFGWDTNLTFPPTDLNPPPCTTTPCISAPLSQMVFRGDIYDQALAALWFIERARLDYYNAKDPNNNLDRANNLLDAIILLREHDPIPDGRIRTAYWANNLLNPAGTEASIMDPSTGVGNMAWFGIALTRFVYVAEITNYLDQLQRQGYLNIAKETADWIIDNCEDTDWPYGYTGGYEDWEQVPFTWKSTEHNIDVFTFSKNLQQLDSDPNWINMSYYAGQFVRNMFNPVMGYYYTGTIDDGIAPNPSPIPADGQSWSACSLVDKHAKSEHALKFLAKPGLDPNDPNDLLVLSNCCTQTYLGIKFSDTGTNIQNEATAGAVIAFYLAGRHNEAQLLLENIDLIRKSSCRTDDGIAQGIGIVATPCLEGAWTGYGVKAWYYNLRHVASSAWTGLAALVLQDNEMANPLKPLMIDGDFSKDFKVNVFDFSLISQKWQRNNCNLSYWCDGVDLNFDGDITINDLVIFTEHWLESIN